MKEMFCASESFMWFQKNRKWKFGSFVERCLANKTIYNWFFCYKSNDDLESTLYQIYDVWYAKLKKSYRPTNLWIKLLQGTKLYIKTNKSIIYYTQNKKSLGTLIII